MPSGVTAKGPYYHNLAAASLAPAAGRRMLREFFASGPRWRLAFAWSGLVAFFGHALFKAWLKYALNEWYAQFYDALQDIYWEPASGETRDDVATHLLTKQNEVSGLLTQFALIVSPAIVVHPVAKWISSHWRFSWRMALMRAYLLHYDVGQKPVEGSAQRIHEDTQRFEQGIYTCFATIVDSILTLAIFVPVLLDVGRSSRPGGVMDFDGWLVSIAVSAAVGGLMVSMVVGHRLVGLEVENQKVEALLRTQLVVLEQTPVAIVGLDRGEAEGDGGGEGHEQDGCVDPDEFTDVSRQPPRPRDVTPAPFFRGVTRDLRKNYSNLFANFAAFNTWISAYDQVMIIVPFALAAPLMFASDPSRRITLGTLMKISNAFGQVFGAMAVVSENWSSVNEFRSTVFRLGEFERHIYRRKRFDHTLLRDFDLTNTEVFGIPRLAEGEPMVEVAVAVELGELGEPGPGGPPRGNGNGTCTRTESGRVRA